jgi:hypothetical protein
MHQVRVQFYEAQYWTSDADYALIARAQGFPAHVDDLDLSLNEAQWDAIQDADQDFDAALQDQIDFHDNAEIAIGVSVGAGVVIGGVLTGGLVVTLAAGTAWAPVLASAGGGLFAASALTAAETRWEDGQDVSEVIVGAASDVSGFTSLYASITLEDPVTGEEIPMTPFERGFGGATGAGQLVLTLASTAVGAANGFNAVRVKIANLADNVRQPPPLVFASADGLVIGGGGGGGGGGALVAVASPAIEGVAVDVITTSVAGGAPVVVYMTRLGVGDGASTPLGGSYGRVRNTNVGGEVHHVPADATTHWSKRDGPAVWMERADHRQTASWGSSREARLYRSQQRDLIEQGRVREAVQMDIDDIRAKFGSKYDEGFRTDAHLPQHTDPIEAH